MDWKQTIIEINTKLDKYIEHNKLLQERLVSEQAKTSGLEDRLRGALTDTQQANNKIGTLEARLATLDATAADRTQLETEQKAFDKQKTDFEQLYYRKGYLAAVTEYFQKAGGKV